MANYRYPGAQPFSTSQEHIFFGRERDIDALYRFIRLEPLVVLHSKSGLGKSSLLNAGVVPRVLKDGKYRPVNIRFNAYNQSSDSVLLPLEATQEALLAACQSTDKKTFLEKLLPKEDSLWYLTKREQAYPGNDRRLLLLFDQFEELFTYPESAIDEFKKQLAEVMHTQIPQRFREVVEREVENPIQLTPGQLALVHQPYETRIVFAIRSDRISLLDQIADYLPEAKRNWYELGAFQRGQAEDAILNPACKKGEFVSPIFDYNDEAIEKILGYLTQDGLYKIESFQLQILCQAVERKVIRQGLQEVSATELGNIEEVYENYYEDQISLIKDIEDQLAARRFIEEGLIFEEEERRLNLYEGQIFRQFGISETLLRQLEDTHLIRREPSLMGDYTYELSHDTLVAPVLKAKGQRLAKERQAQEEVERLHQQQELTKAKRKAEEERQLREVAERSGKRARQRTLIAATLALLAIGVAAWAFSLKSKAQILTKQSNDQKVQIQNNLDAMTEKDQELQVSFYEEQIAKDTAEIRRKEAEEEKQNALTAALNAQLQTRKAKADALATKALLYYPQDNTLAFNLAKAAYQLYPTKESEEVWSEMLRSPENIFYNKVLEQHNAAVYDFAFSPDGRKILTGSEDGTALIWDVESGKILLTLEGHTSRVSAVDYSPDGKFIITGSYDGTAEIWNAETGEDLITLDENEHLVYDVAYSPDGNEVLTGSADKSVKVWDAKTGNPLRVLKGHADYVYNVTYSPDSRYILSGSADNTAKIWDSKTGGVLHTLQGHTGSIRAVSFSPDQKYVLTGSDDKTAKIWDVKTGYLLYTIDNINAVVNSVAYSPDGNHILIGTNNNTAKIWDTQSHKFLPALKGHLAAINRVAYSPKGNYIVTCSDDKTVKVWDSKFEGFAGVLSKNTSPIISSAYSPDGQQIFTGSSDGQMSIWNAKSGEFLYTIENKKTGDRKINGIVRAYDAEDPLIGATVLIKGTSTGAATDYDGKFSLTVPGGYGILKVSYTGYIVAEVLLNESDFYEIFLEEAIVLGGQGPKHKVEWILRDARAVAYSPDGRRILFSSGGNSAKIREVKSGNVLFTLKHDKAITAANYSPDGKYIVTASMDKTVRIWNAETGKVLQIFNNHSDAVLSVVYSPNGKNILTGSADNTAKVWNVKSGKVLLTLKHDQSITAANYSPDGKYIVTASMDKIARIWNAETGEVLHILNKHSDAVLSVVYSPNGEHILTGSADNTAKIWDAKSGKELATLKGHADYIRVVAYSPDSKQILTCSNDYNYTAIVWNNYIWQWEKGFIYKLNKMQKETFGIDWEY